jgi:phosphinothricin acetyltransferase
MTPPRGAAHSENARTRGAGTIRDARAADMAAIQAIYAHHVRHGLASFEYDPPDVAEMTARWQSVVSKGLPYRVIEDEGRIAGFAYAAPYRARIAYRFTVEDSVYIAPDASGRGLGKMLLADIVDQATRAGMRQMVAVIGDSANTASIGLHRSLGFREIGVLRSVGFKKSHWLDSVLMQRALGEGDESPPKE